MGKLNFLEELLIMVRNGEIRTEEAPEDAGKLLLEIRQIVCEKVQEEIYSDVTDGQTMYYAPEYESWKTFLNKCNGTADYKEVLEESYTEEQLENLWQSSHIMEDMPREQITEELLYQIDLLRILTTPIQLVGQPAPYQKLEQERAADEIQQEPIKNRIKGLLNMLYE